MEKIFLGIPTYDGSIRAGIMHATRTASKDYPISIQTSSFSCLTKNFNMIWATALNLRSEGYTKFIMLHDDITPEAHFADKMMKIMADQKADVLSVISPIKSHEGLTSTAIDLETEDPESHWEIKRLTLKEVFDKPPTFTNEKLLINTGLMLVDLTKPWVEKICFKFEDAIIQQDGKFKAVGISEDWLFSREAKKLGAKLFATRDVRITHHGHASYTNDSSWGTLQEDRINLRPLAQPKTAHASM